MVLNATSNNISVLSWLLVLLVGESGGNYTPTCRKSLTKFITDVVSSTPRLGGIRTHNVSGDRHRLHW